MDERAPTPAAAGRPATRGPDGSPSPVERQPPARAGASAAIVMAALVLVALNLRPPLASTSALLDTIEKDLDMSRAMAGLLTTIPIVCFGFGGLVTARVAIRFGLERALFGAILLTGVATAARWGGEVVAVLFAATFGVGVGTAIAQTVLPAMVKRYFPTRAALTTGVYVASMQLGAGFAAIATVPLSRGLDSWAAALGVWALLCIAPAVAMLPVTRQAPRRAPPALAPTGRLPWREPRAWAITAVQTTAALIFFCALTWLAPSFVDDGFTDARAGVLLSVFAFVQIPAALGFSSLASRGVDRRPWVAITLVLAAAGFVLVAFLPSSLAAVGVAVLGVGSGGIFPLVLTLSVDEALDPGGASRYAAMALGVGYLIASIGPVLVGGVGDLTGSFDAPFLALAGLSAGTVALVARLSPPAHASEDDGRRGEPS